MATVGANPVLQFLRQLGVAEGTARLPDRDLLRCFVQQGDEAAFAALVQRHGPMVLRVCLQVLHQEQNAEDAFQATFLILSRKAGSLQKQDSLASWLYGVAHHAATDLKRSLARRRARENRTPPVATADPLAALTVREGQDILHQELCRLPEKYRAPLVLCCLEGLARDEAARQLGWPLRKLKSRLEQARKVLSRRLVRRGLSLSGAFAALVLCDNAASATLPASLVSLVVRAAKSFSASGAGSSAISASVAALTKGVLSAMALSKLKSAAALLLVLGALVVGATVPTLTRAATRAEGVEGANPPQASQTRAVAMTAPRDESKPADDVSFAFGQVVQIQFFLKNTGKESLEVSYPRLIGPSYYRSLRFLDKGGEQLPVRHKDQPAVPVGWVGTRLPGGGQAETAGGFLSIGEGANKDSADAVLKAKAGEAYSVQYTLPNYGDSKAGDLKTGGFRFRVLKKGEPESEQLAAGERQKHIAWGKPGKNGLQVGVLIVPLEQRDGDRKK